MLAGLMSRCTMPFAMGRVQGIGDLNGPVQQLFQLQGLATDALSEGLAFRSSKTR
jgi:hypothetical protein